MSSATEYLQHAEENFSTASTVLSAMAQGMTAFSKMVQSLTEEAKNAIGYNEKMRQDKLADLMVRYGNAISTLKHIQQTESVKLAAVVSLGFQNLMSAIKDSDIQSFESDLLQTYHRQLNELIESVREAKRYIALLAGTASATPSTFSVAVKNEAEELSTLLFSIAGQLGAMELQADYLKQLIKDRLRKPAA